MSERCGYTVIDKHGEEQPCDRPATGWRWYQGHDHEDTLDAACELHVNEGGERMHRLEVEVVRLRGERNTRLDEAAQRGYELAKRMYQQDAMEAKPLRAALVEREGELVRVRAERDVLRAALDVALDRTVDQ